MRQYIKSGMVMLISSLAGCSSIAYGAQGPSAPATTERLIFLCVLGVAAVLIGYAVYKAHHR